MSLALPTSPAPRFQPCKAVCFAMALLSAVPLMLGSPAQAQTTDPTDLTNSGATFTILNLYPTLGTTAGGITIASNDLLTSSGAVNLSGSVLDLSGSTLTLNAATATTTSTETTTTTTGSSGLIISCVGGATITLGGSTISLRDSTISLGSSISVGNTFTGVTSTNVSNLVITGSSQGSITLGTAGGVRVLTLANNATTTGAVLNVSSGGIQNLVVGASSSGALTLNGATTLGTLPTSGTINLSSGGTLNLTGLNDSGLTLVIGNASTVGGIALGTSGLVITAASSGTTVQTTSGTVRVDALGSLPAGNTPSSASFAAPAVALLGVGDVGGQSISERGVVYSLTAANSMPTLGGAGVVKVVHTGLPDATGGFSLTATGLAANTAYTYRVYATDSTGATYLSPATTFTTPTVLQNWRQTFFGTIQGTNHAADNADPDGDGLPNLIEFATGKNPTTPNAAAATPSFSGGALEYTYTRSLDALNSGTTFTVEWNDTLDPTQWSSTGVTEAILSDNGLIQQVKATLPASSTGRRFVRLKVLPPATTTTGVININTIPATTSAP